MSSDAAMMTATGAAKSGARHEHLYTMLHGSENGVNVIIVLGCRCGDLVVKRIPIAEE